MDAKEGCQMGMERKYVEKGMVLSKVELAELVLRK